MLHFVDDHDALLTEHSQKNGFSYFMRERFHIGTSHAARREEVGGAESQPGQHGAEGITTGLGLLLHKVVNPIVMAFVFFGAVLPTGFIMRSLGKDPLRLKYQPDANSYWIERRPPGPAPESLKDQF